MYNQRPRNGYSRGNNRQQTSQSRFSSRESRGRMDKKLDSRYFVNEAKETTAEDTYIPKNTFDEFQISDALKQNISVKNYTHPTPIQDQTILHSLEGRDVIGIANTGTGKTAAFLIPLIDKVYRNKRERVLIVTPTRELALQIYDEFRSFSHGLHMFAALCIGGTNMHGQRMAMRQRPAFVIGTPGRLKDLINRRDLDISTFHSIVLDEVDRMVDIGFIHDIKFLISLLPQERQSLFFSATVSGPVKDILHTFVKDPVTVSVKTQETSEHISQDIIKVGNAAEKIEKLHDLLIQKEFEKVLIFGRTKWGIEKLTKNLIARGFRASAIHGNKTQGARQRALQEFKTNRIQILLATDVASRGLDIEDVTHVINYDQPATYDDYVHRIGRTGRANKKGTALTFVE